MDLSQYNVTVIVPAAGVGQRFGSVVPKQYTNVHNTPIIIHTLTTILSLPFVQNIIVAVSPSDTFIQPLLIKHNLSDHAIHVIHGGAERADTVLAALQHPAIATADCVLVHDAVRPLASSSLFNRILQSTMDYGLAIPGIMVTDTVKEVNEKGAVVRTIPRETMRTIQTPQGFRKDVIQTLLQADSHGATDEAMLAERCGIPVTVVDGEPWNIKVTTGMDITLLEALTGWHAQQGTSTSR